MVGSCKDLSDVFSFHHLIRSLTADLEKQQAGNHTLATILSGLFCCSTLSLGVSRVVVWNLFDFFICFSCFLKQGQQDIFRKEIGSVPFLIPPFCAQGGSTSAVRRKSTSYFYISLFFVLPGDCIVVRIA